MANRFPIIIDNVANRLKELPAGDNLDLSQSNISNVGEINSNGNITVANTYYYIGDGTYLSNINTDRLTNGNSNIIISQNSNIRLSIAGEANIVELGKDDITVNANANFTGNIAAGNTVSANFFIGDGGLLSNIDSTSIKNAASNVRVFANSNVTISINGTANTAEFASDRVVFSSNIEAANGFYFKGDGGLLSNLNVDPSGISNGDSNVRVLTANGDVAVGISGTANFVSINANTGMTVNSNITAGNIQANFIQANFFIGDGGLLSNIDSTSIKNGTSNVRVLSNANINFSVAGTANVARISTAGFIGNVTSFSSTALALTATGGNSNVILTPSGTGVIDASSVRIANVGTPTQDSDAATKLYVDNIARGLNVHDAVSAATNNTLASLTGGTVTYNNGASGVGAKLVLSNPLTTLDGVTLVDGDRVLVKNEANSVHNGIYTRASSGGELTRATDFDTNTEIESGDFFLVNGGTLYGNTGWVQTAKITSIGTSNVVFAQFSGVGTYTAANGLYSSGTEFGISNTAVTAGTYGNAEQSATFTVNGRGQLTAASAANITANANLLLGNRLANNVVNSNLTNLGTLTALTVNGNTTTTNLTVTSSMTVSNITGNVFTANILNGVIGANYSSQPNIAQLGTLTGLTVNGVSNLSNVGNVKITGGANGQFLQANGNTGDIRWVEVAKIQWGNTEANIKEINGNIDLTVDANVIGAFHTSGLNIKDLTANGMVVLPNAVSNVTLPGGSTGQVLTQAAANGALAWSTISANGAFNIEFAANAGSNGTTSGAWYDDRLPFANSDSRLYSMMGLARDNLNNDPMVITNGLTWADSEPAGEWVADPTQLPAARAFSGWVQIGSRIYVFGGYLAGPVVTNTCLYYDMATETIGTVANMPNQKVGAWAAYDSVNNHVYVGGGYSDAGVTHSTLTFKYDVSTNTWTTVASAPAGIAGAASIYYNGAVYVAGGYRVGVGDQSECRKYTIATNTWSSVASMPEIRNFDGSNQPLIYRDVWYLYGGVNNTGAKQNILRYDFASNTWRYVTENVANDSGRGTIFSQAMIIDYSTYGVNYPRLFTVGGSFASGDGTNCYTYWYEPWRGIYGESGKAYPANSARYNFCGSGAWNGYGYVLGGRQVGTSNYFSAVKKFQLNLVNTITSTNNSGFKIHASSRLPNDSNWWMWNPLKGGATAGTDPRWAWVTNSNHKYGFWELFMDTQYYIQQWHFAPRAVTGGDSWYTTTDRGPTDALVVIWGSDNSGQDRWIIGRYTINPSNHNNFFLNPQPHRNLNWIRFELFKGGGFHPGIGRMYAYGRKV